MTCLLFDSHRDDLPDTLDLILHNQDHLLPWNHPLGLTVLLVRQCGFSSMVEQNARDKEVLGAEIQTNSTKWDDPGKMDMVKWPHDFFHATTVLHICHNQLLFLHYAIDFELQVWRFLQRVLEDKSLVLLKGVKVDGDEHQMIKDEIAFQQAYTTSRKGQVTILQNRVQFQIELVGAPNSLLQHSLT